MENKTGLIRQRSSEVKKAQAVALVRQISRLSSGSEVPLTPSARPRIQVTAGLSRKLSRRLDISFDKLDISAFPFQFCNSTVSCGRIALYYLESLSSVFASHFLMLFFPHCNLISTRTFLRQQDAV